MSGTWFEWLVELPVVADLVIRVTVLLALAWAVHFWMASRNPRWRVQLWRMTCLGIIGVAVSTLMPRMVIGVLPMSPPAGSTSVVTNTPAFGAAMMAGNDIELNRSGHEGFFGAVSDTRTHSFASSQSLSEVNAIEPSTSPFASRLLQHWQLMLLVIWSAGVCFFVVRWCSAQVRIRRLLARSFPAPDCCGRALARTSEVLSVRRSVELRVSHDTDVPYVTGIFRPVIVLPAQMAERQESEELQAVLAHELAHIQSHDLIWMALAQWISIWVWFHPLVWRLQSAHGMACEEVADFVAARDVGNTERYSGFLARIALSTASHPPTLVAMSMARSPQIMSRLAKLRQGLSASPLARRRVTLSLVMGLLVLAPVAGFNLSFAADDRLTAGFDSDTTPGRVLEFPAAYSVGELSIATEEDSDWVDRHEKHFDYRRDWDWKSAGLAQGRVKIPADAKVKLTLKAEGARDMSWVKKLQPDDLHEVFIYPHPANANSYPFGDAHAKHLGHFSGLKILAMAYVQVTNRGLQHLESMTSLEVLSIYSPEMGNEGLKNIGKLTSLEKLSLSTMKWTDRGLVHLANLKSLEEINLPHPGKPGRGFDTVISLPKLRYISAGTRFTDEHLQRLKGAKSLTALDLGQCAGITNSGLRHLRNLPKLEYLALYKTNITDAGVKHLAPLLSLKRLSLQVNMFLPESREFAITDSSAKILAKMPSLERLDLPPVGNVDEFLNHLSELHNLRSLWIGGMRRTGPITDVGMGHIARLKQLERLTLSETDFTDAALDSLAKLTRLKRLHLNGVAVSAEGLGKLSTLKQLRHLHLSYSRKKGKLRHSGFSQLNGLSELREIWFYGSKPLEGEEPLDFSGLPKLEVLTVSGMRDEDLAGVAICRNLKRLCAANNSHVTDKGLSHIAGLTSLELFGINGGGIITDGITDAGMACFADMDNLRMLDVSGNITDVGLRHIAGLESLASLRIRSPGQFSPGEIQHLQASLPNLYSLNIDQDRATNSTPVTKLKIGQTAPPFSLTSLEGRKLTNVDYRGKVLLLYFWSTSCAPCVASMPKTKESYEQLSKYDDFAMISLSGDANESLLRTFLRKHKPTWPQTRIGSESKLADAYGVTGYPTYILIDRDGKILCVGKRNLDKRLRESLDIDDKV